MSTASLGSEGTDSVSPVSVLEAEPDPVPAPAYQADAIPPAAPSTVSPYRWIILIGLISAVIMEALDTTIINVALPQMGGTLGATPNEIGWVSTGYILSVVVVLPLTAWLASRFGRKRYLVASILLFVSASFFCGISHSLEQIVFWRILQGIGGGALLSTAQATLLEIFPSEQQGMVQSIFGLGVVVAPAVAPMLGGWLTDNYSWPWVFFVNLPIGVVSTFLVATYLENSRYENKSADSVDWTGIGLLAVGLASFQYVLQEGQLQDWFSSALITRLAVLSGVALTAFVLWELWPSNQYPAVNLRVLRDRNLLGGSLLGAAMGFGLVGGLFIFPLFVQGVLGFTATETGIVLFPAGLAILFGIGLCGALIQKGFDARILIAAGIFIFMYANWSLGHLSPQSDANSTQLGQILRGLGIGFLFIPVSVSAYSTLRGAQIAQGTALWNLSLQIGSSVGIAILNTYVVNMTAYHRSHLVSFLFSGNTALAERQNGLAQAFVAHGYGVYQAQKMALGVIDHTVQVQAQTMAYNNAFIMIGLVFACFLPVILLLQRPKPGASLPGLH
jgi:DHA2 family multidrug resistance protein